jgi:hypothetical protein
MRDGGVPAADAESDVVEEEEGVRDDRARAVKDRVAANRVHVIHLLRPLHH